MFQKFLQKKPHKLEEGYPHKLLAFLFNFPEPFKNDPKILNEAHFIIAGLTPNGEANVEKAIMMQSRLEGTFCVCVCVYVNVYPPFKMYTQVCMLVHMFIVSRRWAEKKVQCFAKQG